jgi:uncharacterized membrane protein YjjP (DUF1212 family)
MLGSETITEPIPVVERLKNTPYSNPRRAELGADDELRHSLGLVVAIGMALLDAGAGTAELGTAMLASAVALGLDESYLTIDITLGSVIVSYGRPGDWPLTMLRVVRRPGRDYARLSDVHALVVDLVDGHLDLNSARRRLKALQAAPRVYQRRWVTLSWAVLAALVVVILGGGPVNAATAFAVTTIVDRVGRWASGRQWPPFFVTFFGAALAASAAVLLAEASQRWALGIDNPQSSSLVIAGGIIVLLAGVGLVAAVQDGLNGFPVTAVGRVFDVMLTTSAVLAGVGVVLALAAQLDLAGSFLTDPLQGIRTGLLWWAPPLAAAATVASAIGARTPARLLALSGMTGALGYAVYMVLSVTGAPLAFATAVACVLIGSLGRVWALRRRASPMAVVVPATTMLLPGLTIFQGLQEMTTGLAAVGLVTLLGAGATGLAIAAGCALGDALATPLERGMATLDEIRARLARDV